jgi:hypothetical protein
MSRGARVPGVAAVVADYCDLHLDGAADALSFLTARVGLVTPPLVDIFSYRNMIFA